jgi:hypothetical protein
MAAGTRNLEHALANECKDPDCEIHVPSVIEDPNERATALAWYFAGACALAGDDQTTLNQLGRTCWEVK